MLISNQLAWLMSLGVLLLLYSSKFCSLCEVGTFLGVTANFLGSFASSASTSVPLFVTISYTILTLD